MIGGRSALLALLAAAAAGSAALSQDAPVASDQVAASGETTAPSPPASPAPAGTPAPAPAAPAVWTPPPPPAAPGPNATPAERGRYLAVLGDCAGCHSLPGGASLAGGVPLNTPFGQIFSANLTPDPDTGIGRWSAAEFYTAMHTGVRPDGANLYPAFPYPYFTHLSRAQTDDLYAYLRTVPAVRATPPDNRLPFPLNLRFMVKLWNWLNFKPDDSNQAQAWTRGGFLVWGPGHCGACHTPKTLSGGDKRGQALQGGLLDNWFAPDLNGDPRQGLKGWTSADIVEFLRAGRNAHANAIGPMGLVVQDSTSLMSDEDLKAIAVYLKSLPQAVSPPTVAAPDSRQMAAGAAVFADSCSGCHREKATGAPAFFPALAGNADLQAQDPHTAIRVILAGAQSAATPTRPTSPSMPAYAWKLTDAEVAAVATYVRNSWGNAAPAVSAQDVARVRGKVAAHPVTKPDPTV